MSVWERRALNLLLIAALVWGVCVVCRATLSVNRSTDLGVYLAAAQAVREHADLYTATYNDNHYQYPPLFALLLAHIVPAPPQRGIPVSAAFAITAGIWYLLSLLALAVSVRVLSGTLLPINSRTAPSPPAAVSPAWILQLLPILVSLHCLGRELQLGQVDLFVLALLSFTIASAVAGQSVRAGLWLAAAICLKGMPLVLLLYPLWRRDWRWLLSCAIGLVLGLIVIPVLLLGYAETSRLTREYTNVLLLPALTGKATDHSRDAEMLNQNAVHNNSLLGVLHNLQHLSEPREARPKIASALNRRLAAVLGTLLTLLTLLASGTAKKLSRLATVLCLAMLMVMMLIGNPVCQSYTLILLIPALLAVTAADLNRYGGRFPKPVTLVVFLALVLAQAVSSFSPLLRDSGLILLAVLALWLIALVALGREKRSPGQVLNPNLS